MARRRRRQRFSLVRLLGQVGGWVCGLWLAGFAIFLIIVFTSSPPNPLPPPMA